jgi:threonine synthase
MITLATAHPAKFPDAVRRAGYPEDPQLPAHMADLFERAERFNVLDNDRAAVEHFMSQRIGVGS